jgi:hypothetical protein
MPCGQVGFMTHACTSVIGPIAPERSSSTVIRRPSEAWPLVAHLGRDLVLRRGIPEGVRFEDRVAERLLAVDVLAHPHRHHGRRRVDVVGRADHDRVDVLLLLEHAAEVDVAPAPGVQLRGLAEVVASMSQSATMFSLATPFRFAAPRPVTPMQARFSFSFGEAETRGSRRPRSRRRRLEGTATTERNPHGCPSVNRRISCIVRKDPMRKTFPHGRRRR